MINVEQIVPGHYAVLRHVAGMPVPVIVREFLSKEEADEYAESYAEKIDEFYEE